MHLKNQFMKRILFSIVILLAACTKENIVEVSPITQDADVISFKDGDVVTKIEACDVANLFFSNLPNKIENKVLDTKVSNVKNKKIVKSIETFFHERSDTPAMYLINYNGGGFIIISATKSYYPILAYSENNSLSIDSIHNMNVGLSIWTEEAKLAIKESKTFSEETSSNIRILWTAYESESPTISKETTVNYTYEQYMKFYQRMSQLYTLCPGYSFGPLSSARSFLSESDYNNLVNIANAYGSPLECTIVGYKQRPVEEVGPLIGTEWHQHQPYNNLCPNQYPAGCVAIAMAQIMKFHGVPRTYNWNNMPNSSGTFDTQTLIYDIGRATNMDYGSDGSSTTIDEAKDAFSSMGYNVSKKDHNYEDVGNELLIRKRPVYMRGDRKTF